MDPHEKLQSGAVISKMKSRPLPPPPRPPRDKQGRKGDSVEGKSKDDQPPEDHDDKHGGALPILRGENSFNENEVQSPEESSHMIRTVPRLQADDSFNDSDVSRRETHPLESGESFGDDYKIEEVDAYVQTDPLPDDFQLEELEITEDMRTITPTMYRMLEDSIHREHESVPSGHSTRPETPSIEQELQRIRDARPSSRHSHTSRTPSRPTTPALIYVERKISTPLTVGEQVEASLTAHPVELDFDELTGNVIVSPVVSDRTVQHVEDQKTEEPAFEKKTSPVLQEASKPVPLSLETPVVEEQRLPMEEPIIVAVRREPPMQRHQPAEPPTLQEPTQQEPLKQQQEQHPAKDEPVIQQEPTPHVLQSDQPLHLSSLSVDRLSVNELQASKISVSELESSAINSREIQCQSGNLNIKSIEIPPGFIEEIVERVSRIQREPVQATEEVSIPSPSFQKISSPVSTQTVVEEEHLEREVEQPIPPPRRPRPQEVEPLEPTPPSILNLSGQLVSACGSEISRQSRSFMTFLRSASKDERRRDLHFVLFVFIIIIAGLFMIGMDHSDRNIHHHHWDFFNPPKNGGP